MNKNRTITAPSGKVFSTEEVDAAEDRVYEIALVNPSKAPELMATFARACFQLSRIIKEIHLEYLLSEQAVSARKAVLMIDVIPEKLAEKKLGNNDANRQALLDLDPEYAMLIRKSAEWEVLLAYFRRQADNMEGALNAVKKAIQDTESIYNRPNYNLYTTNSPINIPESPVDLTPKITDEVRAVGATGLKIGKVKY